MKFTSLADALGTIDLSRASSDPLAILQGHWEEIVGVALAAHTFPRSLEGTTLTVTARSSGWTQNLAWLAEPILAALKKHGFTVEQLVYRVGKIPQRRARTLPGERGAASPAIPERPGRVPPSATAGEALTRFRDEIEANRRAKRGLGWKECIRCGALFAPQSGSACLLCMLVERENRDRTVSRLLFEEPWIGFERAHVAIAGLSREEFTGIRRELLRRWGDLVNRLARARGAPISIQERTVALAFIALKTGHVPAELADATLRNEFGDELFARLFEAETEK